MTHDVVLSGCVPTVLASYLKALAVHRLVGEQVDAGALSYWDQDDRFHVVSSLDAGALVAFFVERYAPTPIVTPWNGGSGFFPKDQMAGIDALARSTEPRFDAYRAAIAECKTLLAELGVVEKPSEDDKARLLRRARACLSDRVLPWLDAAYVIGEEPRYPALLGTGGNDGRLEFANNFMQRIAELFLVDGTKKKRGALDAAASLRAAIFGDAVAGALRPVAVGQFAPSRAGGTNMTAGIDAEAAVNPWDFIFAIEGAILFAGAAVRRLETGRRGKAAFPFHLNASSIGYGASSDHDGDDARGELWLPLWPSPSTHGELRLLFGEGRIELGGKAAATGLDAVRAIASLGVDRGVDRFERFGLLRRNGLSFLATALGSQSVRRIARVDLLRDLDKFLDEVRRLDRPSPTVAAARRALEEEMFAACRRDRALAPALAAVGALERAVARSVKAHDKVRPIARLSPEWYKASDDGSPEFAVASAVASWAGVRAALEPVDERGRWTSDKPTWSERAPLANIVEIARRRLLDADAGDVPLGGAPAIDARALTALLDGTLDPRRLTDLVFGLALVEGLAPEVSPPVASDEITRIDRVFAVLRVATSPRILADGDRHPAPRVIPAILARVLANSIGDALAVAERRIVSSGRALLTPVRAVGRPRDPVALAAALVVPLPARLERSLVASVLRRPSPENPPRNIEMERNHD